MQFIDKKMARKYNTRDRNIENTVMKRKSKSIPAFREKTSRAESVFRRQEFRKPPLSRRPKTMAAPGGR